VDPDHADESRVDGDWISFYDEAARIVATIRGDKVLGITRAEDKPILAR
jgi:hypothetical protein